MAPPAAASMGVLGTLSALSVVWTDWSGKTARVADNRAALS
jgi:hypothetical protein